MWVMASTVGVEPTANQVVLNTLSDEPAARVLTKRSYVPMTPDVAVVVVDVTKMMRYWSPGVNPIGSNGAAEAAGRNARVHMAAAIVNLFRRNRVSSKNNLVGE